MKVLKNAYSYYWPEVREVIDEVVANYPHNVYMRSLSTGLDDFEKPIIEKLIKYREESVPALCDYSFRYSTNGAEEAIRETLVELAKSGVKEIYVLRGDYEGYEAVAKTRGINTRFVDENEVDGLEPGFFYIANPSGRDGNIIENEFIIGLCEAGHKIYCDLSYLGLTKPHVFDVSHPNIQAVFISFSKPFGLFYYRQGFCFSRQEIPGLFGNKWFKNILSLIIADRIMDRIGPSQIYDKYSASKSKILDLVKEEIGVRPNSSDVLFLSTLDDKNLSDNLKEKLANFKRYNKYRLCLSPYFEDLEL